MTTFVYKIITGARRRGLPALPSAQDTKDQERKAMGEIFAQEERGEHTLISYIF